MIKARTKKMDEIKEEREGEISTRTQGNKERKTDLLSPWESPESTAKILSVLLTMSEYLSV